MREIIEKIQTMEDEILLMMQKFILHGLTFLNYLSHRIVFGEMLPNQNGLGKGRVSFLRNIIMEFENVDEKVLGKM